MKFDVDNHLGAVERSVSWLERDGQSASAVTLSRSFATTVDDLWDAVTNGERIPRWFSPVSGDLQLGGRYQLEGNAGGTITACEPPSHFALTWEFYGTSWVEVRVADGGDGGARLTLSHIAHLSDHWDQYGPGAAGVGWEMGLLGLALHIAQPDARSPTKPPSRLHRTARRSSPAAARDGSRPRSRPARIPRPPMPRRRGRPPSTPANQPPESLRRGRAAQTPGQAWLGGDGAEGNDGRAQNISGSVRLRSSCPR